MHLKILEKKRTKIIIILIISILTFSFISNSYLSGMTSPEEVSYFDIDKDGDVYHAVYTVHKPQKVGYERDHDNDYEVYYRRLTDTGKWSDDPLLIDSYHFESYDDPPDYKIIAEQGKIGIFWASGGQIDYIKSVDNGETWSKVKTIDIKLDSFINDFKVKSNEDRVFILYQSSHSFNYEDLSTNFTSYDVKLTYSDLNLSNWSTPQLISQDDDEDSEDAFISVTGNNIVVTWKYDEPDEINKYNKYMRVSEDGGEDWGRLIKLDKPSKRAFYKNGTIYSFYTTENEVYLYLMNKTGSIIEGPKSFGLSTSHPNLIDIYHDERFYILVEDKTTVTTKEGTKISNKYFLFRTNGSKIVDHENNPVIKHSENRFTKEYELFVDSDENYHIFYLYEEEIDIWTLNHFMYATSGFEETHITEVELFKITEIEPLNSPKKVGILASMILLTLSFLLFLFLNYGLIRTEKLKYLSNLQFLGYLSSNEEDSFSGLRRFNFIVIPLSCLILGILSPLNTLFVMIAIVAVIILFLLDFCLIIEEKINKDGGPKELRILYSTPLIWLYPILLMIINNKLFHVLREITDSASNDLFLLYLLFFPSFISILFLLSLGGLTVRNGYDDKIGLVLSFIEMILFLIIYTYLSYMFVVGISV
ncbi:MAG: sialidase family protein [Thermoplasmatota archaeon]